MSTIRLQYCLTILRGMGQDPRAFAIVRQKNWRLGPAWFPPPVRQNLFSRGRKRLRACWRFGMQLKPSWPSWGEGDVLGGAQMLEW
jgi:hypothetical protein